MRRPTPLKADYDKQQRQALQLFVQTPAGKRLYDSAYQVRLAFNSIRATLTGSRPAAM